MDAQTMAGTRDRLKDKVGWLAYVASGTLTLVQPGFQARASVDGRRPVITRARTVLVCNCSVLPGGVVLVPDGRIDDGALDVLTLSPHALSDGSPASTTLSPDIGTAIASCATRRRERPSLCPVPARSWRKLMETPSAQ